MAEGLPLPTETGIDVQDATTPPVGWVEGIKTIGKQSALPIAGGAIGAGAGMLTGPAAGVASPLLGAIGSGTGEVINQALGITEENPWAIGLSAIPIPGGTIARKSMLTHSGAKAGIEQVITQQLGPRGKMLLNEVRPQTPSADLFARVAATGVPVKVPVAKLDTAIRSIESRFADVPKEFQPKIQGILKGLNQVVTDAGGPHGYVPFNRMRDIQSVVGEDLRSLAALHNKTSKGLGDQLYRAMWEDVDAALATVKGPFGTLVRDAVAARKNEEAVNLLAKAFKPMKSNATMARVDQALERVKDMEGSLSKLLPDGQAGVDDIIQTLELAKAQLKLPGSFPMSVAERHPFAMAGLGIGMAASAGVQTPGALMLGAGSAIALESLGTFLGTTPGRSVVKAMLTKGIALDQIANLMGQGVISAGKSPGAPQQDLTPTGGGLQLQ